MNECVNLSKNISYQDVVTLYSLDVDDIIEICVGEDYSPGLENLLNGKNVGDMIYYSGETFRVQYIAKQKGRNILSTSDTSTHSAGVYDQIEKHIHDESNVVRAVYEGLATGNSLPLSQSFLVLNGVKTEDAHNYLFWRTECAKHGKTYCDSTHRNQEIRAVLFSALKNYCKSFLSVAGKQGLDLPFQVLDKIKKIKSGYQSDYEIIIERTVFEKMFHTYIKSEKSIPSTKPGSCSQFPNHIAKTPDSTVLVAYLKEIGGGKAGCVTIVSDFKDQDAGNGIYWLGRPLPTMILASIRMTTDKSFVYKDKQYKVARYIKYGQIEKYFGIIARFCTPEKPQSIYVYDHKTILSNDVEAYESVTAMIPCANISFPVAVNVYYEKNTQRYFINKETYQNIYKKYGLPYIRLINLNGTQHKTGFSNLRTCSELNLAGYSVNAETGLGMDERRRLLRQIIDSNILSKAQVLNHIEWLINTRIGRQNQSNAVDEWRSDHQFISAYQAETQRKIWVKEFRTKFRCSKD